MFMGVDLKKQELMDLSEESRKRLDNLMNIIIEKNDLLTLVTDIWRVRDVMGINVLTKVSLITNYCLQYFKYLNNKLLWLQSKD